jgi:excisionase family DNA binding protein
MAGPEKGEDGMTDEQGTIFYKPEEVARILQLPRDAVMRAIKSRELSAIKLSSRTYRVTDHQLAEFQRR